MTGDKIYSKVQAQINTVNEVKDWVVVSGGLALHMLSPKHIEDKHLHDHSDVDLFVINPQFFIKMKKLGFHKVWSKYDSTNFYRYMKTIDMEDVINPGKFVRVKVLIDAFIDFNIKHFKLDKFKIIDLNELIKLYELKQHHPSDDNYRTRNIRFLKKYMQNMPS